MTTGVLVFDIDNTLYNFVDFFAPSFRSMVHALSKTEGIAEHEIIRSAKEVYQAAGTLEYQFLIQNMDLFKDRSSDDHERLIRLSRVVFSKTRNARLDLYSGMFDVITSARASGWKCVCVTNAPYYQVAWRLRDLNLLGLLDGLAAWEGRPVDESREEHVRKYSAMRSHLDQRLQLFSMLRTNDLKPSPYPFARIVEHFGRVQDYFSIGDSRNKDLLPASQAGMRTMWARYGTLVNAMNLRTLLDITPWTSDQISIESSEEFEPDFVVDSPREIARTLKIPVQADLFLFDEP